MTFNETIDKIMPEVNRAGNVPFIVFRNDENDWQCDFTQNQYGDKFDWVDEVKKQDPYSVEFTGADFAQGSFAHVYDKVVTARLRAEFDILPPQHENFNDLNALLNVLEDNLGELSQSVIDYIISYDNPLASLNTMLKTSLQSDDPNVSYDADKAWEALDSIEIKITELINRPDDIPLDIDGYNEMYSIKINGRQLFIGENPDVENRYKVCEWQIKPTGEKENTFTGITHDYLEAMDKYTKNVHYYISCAISERDNRQQLYGVVPVVLTSVDCVAKGMDEQLTGKLIVIKSDALPPEKNTSDYQLQTCLGGFGTQSDTKRNAILCKDLFSGKEMYFDRNKILGVANLERLPEWAKTKLETLHNKKSPQEAKKSLQTVLCNAKKKVAQANKNNMEKGNKQSRTGRDGLE